MISSIYWSLLLVFPHLILQAVPGQSEPSSQGIPAIAYVPLDIDLSLHAIPGLSLLLEFILFQDAYSPKVAAYGAPVVTLACTVWYGWWVERCASFNGACALSLYFVPNGRNLMMHIQFLTHFSIIPLKYG